MATEYEWSVVTTQYGADPELESDVDSWGPKVADLQACIAIAQEAQRNGGTATVRLVRSCDGGAVMGWDHDRQEASFTLGEDAPISWDDQPNSQIPKRFRDQWERHGATAESGYSAELQNAHLWLGRALQVQAEATQNRDGSWFWGGFTFPDTAAVQAMVDRMAAQVAQLSAVAAAS